MDPSRLFICLFAATLAGLFSSSALACGEVLRGDMVSAERELGATKQGGEASFHVLGAGWFHAVEITKRGGSNGDTAVTLELDGERLGKRNDPPLVSENARAILAGLGYPEERVESLFARGIVTAPGP